MASGMRQHYAIMLACALSKAWPTASAEKITTEAVERADLLDKKLRRLDRSEEPPMPRRQAPMEEAA